jgi:hypothetical protein
MSTIVTVKGNGYGPVVTATAAVLPIKLLIQMPLISHEPIPVAARSKAWVCGRWLAGIAGSNAFRDIDVFLL